MEKAKLVLISIVASLLLAAPLFAATFTPGDLNAVNITYNSSGWNNDYGFTLDKDKYVYNAVMNLTGHINTPSNLLFWNDTYGINLQSVTTNYSNGEANDLYFYGHTGITAYILHFDRNGNFIDSRGYPGGAAPIASTWGITTNATDEYPDTFWFMWIRTGKTPFGGGGHNESGITLTEYNYNTSSVIRETSLGGSGLTTNGSLLWSCDQYYDQLVILNYTLDIVGNISLANISGSYCDGVTTVDGSRFWVAQDNVMYEIDSAGGILNTTTGILGMGQSLETTDGTYFYTSIGASNDTAYESAKSYPTGVDVYLDTTQIYNGAGELNSIVGVSNFATTIDAELEACTCIGCSLSGNDCTIPFNVSTTTAGIVELSNLDLSIGLRVRAYNEITGAPLTFNLTLTNLSSETTHYDQTDYKQAWNNTTGGSVTAQVSSTGYDSRSYEYVEDEDNGVVINAYLLPTGTGSTVRFHVQDPYDNTISGALVNAKKLINTSWVTVSEDYTDGSGTATLFLNPSTTYLINVSYGAVYSAEYITPTSTDYWITLAVGAGVGDQENIFMGIAYKISPIANTIYPNGSNYGNVNFSIHSVYSDLAYYGLNIDYGGSTIYSTNSSASSSGGIITAYFDLAGWSPGDQLNATAFFQRLGKDEYQILRIYYLQNQTEVSETALSDIMERLAEPSYLGLDSTMRGILVLIVAAFLTAMSVAMIGFRGGGIVFLCIVGIFTFYGWFDPMLYFIMVATLIGAYAFLRSA